MIICIIYPCKQTLRIKVSHKNFPKVEDRNQEIDYELFF